MREAASGAVQLMACNNDDAVRCFDAGSGFKRTAYAWPSLLSQICKALCSVPGHVVEPGRKGGDYYREASWIVLGLVQTARSLEDREDAGAGVLVPDMWHAA